MRGSAHCRRQWLFFLCIPLLLAGLWLPPVLVVEAALPTAQPFQEFLRPDGTLDLPAGFRGSLDARDFGGRAFGGRGSDGQGWQLVSGPHEAPRFAPTARSTGPSPLAADDHWDGRFGPSGTDGPVYTLAVDGSGNVYVGGTFTMAGGIPAYHIARWNGSAWSALGSGMDGTVSALAVDGSGNLYTGGYFNSAGGVPAHYIARWNGSAWSALGSGMGGAYPSVSALAVDDSGNLYAGGIFTTAGGVPANGVARWDGSAWAPLGSGMGYAVSSLAVDGSGSLYAAGWFDRAGGVPANRIARWDGSTWAALGSGMNDGIWALAVDGSGTLYAGGDFTTAGNKPSSYIARWFNTAPAANPDNYSVPVDTALIVKAPGVLRNDVDAEGDVLAAELDTPPVTGTLVLNAEGSFVYTPSAGFTGTVSFTYQAGDGQAYSMPAVVTITVGVEPVDSWTVFLPAVFRQAGR